MLTEPQNLGIQKGDTVIALNEEEFMAHNKNLKWLRKMEYYAGKEGEVTSLDEKDVLLKFPDGWTWWYPLAGYMR